MGKYSDKSLKVSRKYLLHAKFEVAERIWFYLIPTAQGRVKWLRKHKKLAMLGEHVHWQPRKYPTDGNMLKVHDNVAIASNVEFTMHDIIHWIFDGMEGHYQAQKAIRNVAPIQYKTEDDFALKGKICCGNCLRQLRHEKQYGEMVFCCGHKRSVGKFSHCYSGYYREQAVNSRVARAIKTVFTALEVVNQGMQEKKSITLQCVDVDDLKKQAEMIRAEQIKLYESYADGILTRNEYLEKKKGLGEKLADLQEKIRIEEEEQETADELDEEIRSLTKQESQKTYDYFLLGTL